MAKAAIVYVGTSEGLAIYSDPGGSGRWRRIGQSLEGRPVEALLATDALSLLVLSVGTVLSSSDGAQSWQAADAAAEAALLALRAGPEPLVATAHGPARWHGGQNPAPGATALAMLSGKQEVLLAARDAGTTLARSEDGGATWTPASITGALDGQVQTIAPASYHMDIAWAGSDAGQLLRSDDRGRSWQAVAHEQAAILSLAVVRLV
jgi:photosystem II stability/assembly factor-like uncharacterized protein